MCQFYNVALLYCQLDQLAVQLASYITWFQAASLINWLCWVVSFINQLWSVASFHEVHVHASVNVLPVVQRRLFFGAGTLQSGL